VDQYCGIVARTKAQPVGPVTAQTDPDPAQFNWKERRPRPRPDPRPMTQ